MEDILYFAAKCVQVMLNAVSWAMLLRMLLPIFVDPENNKIYIFTVCVTEPFVAPVRAIMVKLNIGQGTPLDWSFTVTYLIIWLLKLLLPAI